MSEQSFERFEAEFPDDSGEAIFLLHAETAIFLQTVAEKLENARQASVEVRGRVDANFVGRVVVSKIGSMRCMRLRFNPPHLGAIDHISNTGMIGDVKELIIEIPDAYDKGVPEVVFTTLRSSTGDERHHVISNHRILDIDPRSQDVIIGQNLETGRIYLRHSNADVEYEEVFTTPDVADRDEINFRLSKISLYNSLLDNYLLGNQSRNDGTAA